MMFEEFTELLETIRTSQNDFEVVEAVMALSDDYIYLEVLAKSLPEGSATIGSILHDTFRMNVT